jgi:hypothetical protein
MTNKRFNELVSQKNWNELWREFSILLKPTTTLTREGFREFMRGNPAIDDIFEFIQSSAIIPDGLYRVSQMVEAQDGEGNWHNARIVVMANEFTIIYDIPGRVRPLPELRDRTTSELIDELGNKKDGWRGVAIALAEGATLNDLLDAAGIDRRVGR